MGNHFSITREGHTESAATDAILASALAYGYEIEKLQSSEMNFRSYIKDEDPAPTKEVFIVKGYGVFNIIHEAIKIGKLVHRVVCNEEKEEESEDEAEVPEDEDETAEDDQSEDNVVVDNRPTVFKASVQYYCSENDASKKE